MTPFASFLPQILRERPLLFWSVLLGALAVLSVVLPVDWNPVSGKGLIDRPEPLGPFSERVVDIDRSLQNGETVEVSPKRAFEIHLHLGTRRLVRAGDMSHGDMQRARKMLREMHAQLRREETTASRDAIRQLWLDRLVAEFPRLDRKKVGPELETLHRQLNAHLKTVKRGQNKG